LGALIFHLVWLPLWFLFLLSARGLRSCQSRSSFRPKSHQVTARSRCGFLADCQMRGLQVPIREPQPDSSSTLLRLAFVDSWSDWQEDECQLGKENRSLFSRKNGCPLSACGRFVRSLSGCHQRQIDVFVCSEGERQNFAMFGRKQFVAKLPKSQVDALVSAGARKRIDPGHDRLMKEWFVAAEMG
jgi:hypothetical protein